MSIDPTILAAGFGLKGEESAAYAAARLAQTEDRELRAFLRKTGATHFLRQPDGSVIAYDDRNRERVVSSSRERYNRWHCERGANWRPRRGDIPKEAERV